MPFILVKGESVSPAKADWIIVPGGLSLVAMAMGAKLGVLLALVCLMVGGSEGSYSSGGGKPYTTPSSSSSTPTPDTTSSSPPYTGTSYIPTPDTPSSTPYTTPTGSSPSINIPPVTVPTTPTPTPVTYTPTTPSGGYGSKPKRSGRGTCKFWRSNTRRFPNIISVLTTISRIFGGISGSRFGSKMTVVDALTNESNDSYSALARHGVASLLNSYTVSDFTYTPEQVREKFNQALATPESAGQQALLFEKANELI